MIGQDHHCIAPKRAVGLRLHIGLAQRIHMVHKHRLTPPPKVDGKEICGTGDAKTPVVRHTDQIRVSWSTLCVGWMKFPLLCRDIMRHLIPVLLLLTTPAHAWEFSPTPICTLTHSEAAMDVKLTYDHATGLYAIALTQPQAWPNAPAFSIRFDGARPNTISTTRHVTDGATLTVTDQGFGNVLDGLEFNSTATAFTNTSAASVSLEGAAAPVQRFRACTTTPIA